MSVTSDKMTSKLSQLIFILLGALLGLSACTEDQMAMSSRTNPVSTPDTSQGGEPDTEDPATSDETLVLQLALDNDKTGSP